MKFYVLQRHFNSSNPKKQFKVYIVTARDEDAAWLEIEETISTNDSQEWLMNLKEFKTLKGFLKEAR